MVLSSLCGAPTVFIDYSCWASGFSRSLCLRTPACLASRCGGIFTHIPCGNVPVWTYDCHQLAMPKWCQEKLHLSYSLSDFMSHDWFRDTPVFPSFDYSHNMLTKGWDYIMKHMTFHDKNSFQHIDVMKVHRQWPTYRHFMVVWNACAAYLTNAGSLKAFYDKYLWHKGTDIFFSLFPNLWTDYMINFLL